MYVQCQKILENRVLFECIRTFHTFHIVINLTTISQLYLQPKSNFIVFQTADYIFGIVLHNLMGSLGRRIIIGRIIPFSYSIILQYEESFQCFCLSIVIFFIEWAKRLDFKFITDIEIFLHFSDNMIPFSQRVIVSSNSMNRI